MGKSLVIKGADFTAMSCGTFVPMSNKVAITTSVSPSNGGSVSGGGTYDEGASVVLTATPNTNYEFTSWDDNSTSNPRTITADGVKTSFVATFTNTAEHQLTSEEAGFKDGMTFSSGTAGTNPGECYAKVQNNASRTLCVIDMTSLKSSGYKTLEISTNTEILCAAIVTNNVLNALEGKESYKLDKTAKDGTISNNFASVTKYTIDLISSDCKDYKYIYVHYMAATADQSTHTYDGDWNIVAKK